MNTLTSQIKLTTKFTFRPLSQRLEDGVAIFSYGSEAIELPPEGIEFIQWLKDGLTIGEARERFEAEFNPFPDEDLWDVIELFVESGFVATIDGRALDDSAEQLIDDTTIIPLKLAQAIFSTPALLGWIAFVTPAMGLWLSQPTLWPTYEDYFWLPYNFLIILIGVLVWLVTMALHELAHLTAARAKGIAAEISWTQRLGFIPMSQTSMHNIWAVPKSDRYIPILSGMMMDIVLLSITIYALSGLVLPTLLVGFLKFFVLILVLGLVSQFWLFSKMDGYYLVSSLLGERNLQTDTIDWFRSKLGRAFTPPASGMRMVYLYAVILVGWGGLFIAQFLAVQLPIRLRLVFESIFKIGSGEALALADGLATLASESIDLSILAYSYLRKN